MTVAFAKLKARLATWREWEMNPVLLKELRQAMRSRTLIGTLMSLLGAFLVLSLMVLMRENILQRDQQQVGLPVLRSFLIVLTVVTFVFIPLYIGFRLAAERQQSNLDLMFITTLGPRRIVRGKLFCGAYLALMFFSVCMPFMTLTNLLRGVDLPSVFVILASLFVVVCLAVQAAIFFASLPLNAAAKTLIGLLFVFALVVGSGGLVAFFFNLLRSGVGNFSFWGGFVAMQLIVLAVIRLLYNKSVILIRADNRPRGYYNELIREGAASA